MSGNIVEKIKKARELSGQVIKTEISVDENGGIWVDSFNKILDYTKDKLVLETKNKTIYIYGDEITVISCDKHTASAQGKVKKIEIFAKEV